MRKSLHVYYTFRGRPHYVEAPDHMPLVLPLEGECRMMRSLIYLNTVLTLTLEFSFYCDITSLRLRVARLLIVDRAEHLVG